MVSSNSNKNIKKQERSLERFLFALYVLTIAIQYVAICVEEAFVMANINIRIDSEVKANAEAVFANIGITPTAAINLFYKQVIRTKSIPFELKADIPNKKTIFALDEVEEMEKNPEKYKGYSSVDGLMEDLL